MLVELYLCNPERFDCEEKSISLSNPSKHHTSMMPHTNFTNFTSVSSSGSTAAVTLNLEYTVAIWIVKYMFCVVIVLGTIGNGLSFIVLSRKRMRGTSVSFYLMCLACADTAVLYFSCFKTWLRVVSGFEMLHVSDAACKTITFIIMVALHLSAWLIVLVTIDRFLVVWFPFKAATWCTLRRSRWIVAIISTVAVLYMAHLFWTLHLQDIPLPSGQVIQICVPLENNMFMSVHYNYMKFASYSIIPFIVVVSMNAAIIVRICRRVAKPVGEQVSFQRHTSNSSNSGSSRRRSCDTRLQSRTQQVTAMLLLVSFVWLFCSLPFTLFSIIPRTYPSSRSRAIAFLAKSCCFLLMYINHSVNFLLYCIAGKRFRTELASLGRDVSALFRHERPKRYFSWKDRSGKRSVQTPVMDKGDGTQQVIRHIF